jgi:hypothetical protein
MENQLILDGNFDNTTHTNKKGCDAFGNEIITPEGYRRLGKISDGVWDKIQKGDLHFDIYGGWTDGHGTYCNETNHYIHEEGRWKAWARKI